MRTIIIGLTIVAIIDWCVIEIIRFFRMRREIKEKIEWLEAEIERKWNRS